MMVSASTKRSSTPGGGKGSGVEGKKRKGCVWVSPQPWKPPPTTSCISSRH